MPAKPPKMPCPKCKAMCKPKAKFCGKCGGPMMAEKADKPTPGDGVTGAAAAAVEPVPEHREPDGPAFEALEHDAGLPTVPDASLKTAVRMQELGVPNQEGMLHDLLCPAYPGASVKAAWPGADLSLVDEQGWQAKAFEASTSAPLGEFQQAAEKASQVWTAARILKSVPADLYEEVMDEAHKAFRDANPGPAKAPQPGEMHAERYNRPYVTAGHAAPSPDHDGPNKAPIHPGHISAADFSRGLITAGHAADSPENDSPRPMPVPAPEVPGVPSRVFYTNTQRQNAAQAMRQMHDHIAQTFPDLCPMHGPGRMGEPPSHARPVAAGVGGPVPHGASKMATGGVVTAIESGSDVVPVMLDNGYVIPAGDAARLARKAEKRKMRELMEAVFKGDKTLDAARAELGFPALPAPAVAKAATAELAPVVAELQVAPIGPSIEEIVTKATAPLLEKLEEQERTLDAIASQPDPAVTAYRGAAIAKASAAPAGPLTVPQRAEHAQDTAYRAMYDQWRNSPDPDLRERAHSYLMGASGLIPRPPS